MSRARSAGTDLRTGSHPAVELAGPAARDEGLPPAHGEGQHGAGRVLAVPHADTAVPVLHLDAVTAGVAVTRLDPHLPGSLTVIGDIGAPAMRLAPSCCTTIICYQPGRSSCTRLDVCLAPLVTSLGGPGPGRASGRVARLRGGRRKRGGQGSMAGWRRRRGPSRRAAAGYRAGR